MKKRQFIGSLLGHRFFQGYGFSIIISILLHIVILGLLSTNWSDDSETRILPPRSIKASVVEITQPKTTPKPPPKRTVDNSAAKKKAEALAAEKRQRDAAKKRAEEKRRKEIALKKRREAEAKAQREKDKKAKEEAARKEKARQRKLAEEKRRKEDAEAERLRQLELQQVAQRAAAAEQAEQDLAEATYYSELLRSLFAQNWNRPPSARNNMTAVVQLALSPYGDLLEVRLLEGSGNDAYDRSVIQAVQRAAPFPELKKLERRVFNEHFKRINFKFRPEDLVR